MPVYLAFVHKVKQGTYIQYIWHISTHFHRVFHVSSHARLFKVVFLPSESKKYSALDNNKNMSWTKLNNREKKILQKIMMTITSWWKLCKASVSQKEQKGEPIWDARRYAGIFNHGTACNKGLSRSTHKTNVSCFFLIKKIEWSTSTAWKRVNEKKLQSRNVQKCFWGGSPKRFSKINKEYGSSSK